jgi:hypothetical protein
MTGRRHGFTPGSDDESDDGESLPFWINHHQTVLILAIDRLIPTVRVSASVWASSYAIHVLWRAATEGRPRKITRGLARYNEARKDTKAIVKLAYINELNSLSRHATVPKDIRCEQLTAIVTHALEHMCADDYELESDTLVGTVYNSQYSVHDTLQFLLGNQYCL